MRVPKLSQKDALEEAVSDYTAGVMPLDKHHPAISTKSGPNTSIVQEEEPGKQDKIETSWPEFRIPEPPLIHSQSHVSSTANGVSSQSHGAPSANQRPVHPSVKSTNDKPPLVQQVLAVSKRGAQTPADPVNVEQVIVYRSVCVKLIIYPIFICYSCSGEHIYININLQLRLIPVFC